MPRARAPAFFCGFAADVLGRDARFDLELATLRDAQYAHVQYFMYTEVDQWMVYPHARLEPLWRARIRPQLREGRSVLVVAHRNSIRSLAQLVDAGTVLLRVGAGASDGAGIPGSPLWCGPRW